MNKDWEKEINSTLEKLQKQAYKYGEAGVATGWLPLRKEEAQKTIEKELDKQRTKIFKEVRETIINDFSKHDKKDIFELKLKKLKELEDD